MEIVINLIVAVVILGVTYALASEGLWGAALMFFNVLFGGLIAFNFYEPLAKLLADNVPLLSGFADTACLHVALHRLDLPAPLDDRDPRAGDGPVPDAALPPGPMGLRARVQPASRWRSCCSPSTPRRSTRRSSA